MLFHSIVSFQNSIVSLYSNSRFNAQSDKLMNSYLLKSGLTINHVMYDLSGDGVDDVD